MEKNNFNHLAILTCMTISIVTAFIYFARIEMDLYEIIKNKHHVLVDFSGTDNAPFKYRNR